MKCAKLILLELELSDQLLFPPSRLSPPLARYLKYGIPCLELNPAPGVTHWL